MNLVTEKTHPSPSKCDKRTFKMVMLESPYAGFVEDNIEYAQICMHDSIMRGEAPFASHLLYTQPNVLNDNIPCERILGMKAGMEVATRCDASVFYLDRGVSSGMKYGYASAREAGRPIIIRSLDGFEYCFGDDAQKDKEYNDLYFS